jgi:hypothetical protein
MTGGPLGRLNAESRVTPPKGLKSPRGFAEVGTPRVGQRWLSTSVNAGRGVKGRPYLWERRRNGWYTTERKLNQSAGGIRRLTQKKLVRRR